MCNIANCQCGCQEGAKCTCTTKTTEDKAERECDGCNCKDDCGKECHDCE